MQQAVETTEERAWLGRLKSATSPNGRCENSTARSNDVFLVGSTTGLRDARIQDILVNRSRAAMLVCGAIELGVTECFATFRMTRWLS